MNSACQLYLISPLDVDGAFPERLDRVLAEGEGVATAFQFSMKDVDQHEAARLAAPLQEMAHSFPAKPSRASTGLSLNYLNGGASCLKFLVLQSVVSRLTIAFP
jgi:hypothetical protein